MFLKALSRVQVSFQVESTSPTDAAIMQKGSELWQQTALGIIPTIHQQLWTVVTGKHSRPQWCVFLSHPHPCHRTRPVLGLSQASWCIRDVPSPLPHERFCAYSFDLQPLATHIQRKQLLTTGTTRKIYSASVRSMPCLIFQESGSWWWLLVSWHFPAWATVPHNVTAPTASEPQHQPQSLYCTQILAPSVSACCGQCWSYPPLRLQATSISKAPTAAGPGSPEIPLIPTDWLTPSLL